MYLGVRLREEIRQVLAINNAGADKRGAHIRDIKENAKKQFVIEKEGEDPKLSLNTSRQKLPRRNKWSTHS